MDRGTGKPDALMFSRTASVVPGWLIVLHRSPISPSQFSMSTAHEASVPTSDSKVTASSSSRSRRSTLSCSPRATLGMASRAIAGNFSPTVPNLAT